MKDLLLQLQRDITSYSILLLLLFFALVSQSDYLYPNIYYKRKWYKNPLWWWIIMFLIIFGTKALDYYK